MTRPLPSRGWRFPVRRDPATGAVALASEEASVRQSLEIILRTRPGERLLRPGFGCRVHELLFAPATVSTARAAANHVREAVSRWEPRVVVEAVAADLGAPGQLTVRLTYRLRSSARTGALELQLGGR